MGLIRELSKLFDRDIGNLIKNLEETDEQYLWKTPKGVANSCGVLVQHITGNLNHFIGTGLGNTGYVRERDREFTNTQRSKAELLKDLRNLQEMVSLVINELEPDQLKEKYPLQYPYDYTTGEMLLHLYGHLSYHTGQVNYLRRILDKE